MKKIEYIISICLLSILVVIVMLLNYIDNRNLERNTTKIASTSKEIAENNVIVDEMEKVEEIDPIVYEGMRMGELAAQLDKSLTSTLTGTGIYFAKYSIEYGVDPYLAVAISLHETGCRWGCSNLVRQCNNVGGQKFRPACYDGTSFGGYATLEEGIKGFIYNIYNNYIEEGLVTPYDMQRKYVGTDTTTWAPKVEKYMKEIREA